MLKLKTLLLLALLAGTATAQKSTSQYLAISSSPVPKCPGAARPSRNLICFRNNGPSLLLDYSQRWSLLHECHYLWTADPQV
jgi:hypothetical protein